MITALTRPVTKPFAYLDPAELGEDGPLVPVLVKHIYREEADGPEVALVVDREGRLYHIRAGLLIEVEA